MNLNKGVHKSQVAHQAGAYLWFPENEATRSISPPPLLPPPLDGMLVQRAKYYTSY